jgi:hypothetical protein
MSDSLFAEPAPSNSRVIMNSTLSPIYDAALVTIYGLKASKMYIFTILLFYAVIIYVIVVEVMAVGTSAAGIITSLFLVVVSYCAGAGMAHSSEQIQRMGIGFESKSAKKQL